MGAPSAAQEGSDSNSTGVIAQTLKSGDVVSLSVWREPEFSGEYQVDAGGFVTLPRLGPIRVLDFTAEALRTELQMRYRQYLRNPSIQVTVLRRIRIMGAVREPGLYPVDHTVTIADALAMAGGATPNGQIDKVELRRDGEVLAGNLNTNMALAETPLRSGDQLYVPERSWLSRNTGILSAVVGGTISLIIALAR